MKIVTLIENSSRRENIACEHGLCIYMETPLHRLLVDTGASAAVWENARIMGIDPACIDTVVISHGHYDHAGGLVSFTHLNHHADIYMQRSALLPYYHDDKYIGIDPKIAESEKLHLLSGEYRIDDELQIFSGITGRRFWPDSNRLLSVRINGKNVQDPFEHEQCLAVFSEGRRMLISGCAHNGILNILSRYHELYNCDPDIVISGFHMMNKNGHSQREIDQIIETANELKRMDTLFFTGHCTGIPAFEIMKPILGDRLIAIHSGENII